MLEVRRCQMSSELSRCQSINSKTAGCHTAEGVEWHQSTGGIPEAVWPQEDPPLDSDGADCISWPLSIDQPIPFTASSFNSFLGNLECGILDWIEGRETIKKPVKKLLTESDSGSNREKRQQYRATKKSLIIKPHTHTHTHFLARDRQNHVQGPTYV